MKRLFSYIGRYWNRYAFGMVSTLIASACGMSVSYLSGAAINTIQAHHPQTFGALARMGLPAEETLGRIVLMMIAVALVGVILLQRSEGGGLGLGSGNLGGFMSARGAADLMTRTTAILAAGFVVTSMTLAIPAARVRPSKTTSSSRRRNNSVKLPPVSEFVRMIAPTPKSGRKIMSLL